MYREAMRIKIWRQLAIGHTGADGYGTRCRIQAHRLEVFERDLIADRVSDSVEGVSCADSFNTGTGLNYPLYFGNGFGGMQTLRSESVVTGPVRSQAVSAVVDSRVSDS